MNKFRAFDKQTNHMYYSPNSHIYLNIDGTCVNFQNGEELEVMFETDRIEVWESDIVNVRRYKETKWELGVVVPSTSNDGHSVSCPYCKTPKTDYYGIRFSEIYELEVLGNVKQHKIEDFQ